MIKFRFVEFKRIRNETIYINTKSWNVYNNNWYESASSPMCSDYSIFTNKYPVYIIIYIIDGYPKMSLIFLFAISNNLSI